MKKLKYILFALLSIFIIPVGVLFCGCSLFEAPVGIISIEKTSTDGLVDTYTITYTNGSTYTFTVTNGADGADGEKGEKGDKGDTGEKGDKGDTGEKGATGSKGRQGDAGVSITRIAKTGTNGNIDTYTITFSDGSTDTFTVKNGTDGTNGTNGTDGKAITSITKTDTAGNIDTYTINYSDGSSTTFTVKNGIDGVDGEDGEDLTIDAIWETYKEKTGNDSLSLVDFIENYVTYNVTNEYITNNYNITTAESTAIVAKCIQSAVAIEVSQSSGTSCGSGVIFKIDGDNVYILTNYHVTDGRKSDTGSMIAYMYGSNYGFSVSYVGGAISKDLAVVVGSKSTMTSYGLSFSATTFADGYYVGQTALAVGNTKGMGINATKGIVGLESETISYSPDDNASYDFRCLRMDTPIYGGNSGGGLFNSDGELIGVTCAGLSITQRVGISTISIDCDNINYAIPVSVVKSVVNSIIDNGGTAKTATLNVINKTSTDKAGVTVQRYYESEGYVRVEARDGVVLSSSNTLSNNLGLSTGDKITEIIIDGTSYEIYIDYCVTDALINVRNGSTIQVKYTRSGTSKTSSSLTITNSYLSSVA